MCPVPSVSVVMPARNVAPYIDAAVESILAQSVTDFELVIRDDGSVDGTRERLRAWARRDSRIRLFEGDQLGLAGSSNWIVRQARAPLIARMDSDDVARPDRLKRQLEVLRADPAILLVGSLADSIDADGRRIRPMDPWRIARRSWFAPFPHTSIMFRRDSFEAAGGYQPLAYCEDWDFFLRMANQGRVAVIADALVSHRIVGTSSSSAPEHQPVVETAIARMLEALPSPGSEEPYRAATAASAPQRQTERVHPFAIISSNTMHLWAGGTPRVLGALLRRGRLRADMASVGALGWAVLAQISPAMLRLVLTSLLLGRGSIARLKVRRGRVYDWRPGGRNAPVFVTCEAAPSAARD